MRRIIEAFKGWYSAPGSVLLGIPVALAVALCVPVALGILTFGILESHDFLVY